MGPHNDSLPALLGTLPVRQEFGYNGRCWDSGNARKTFNGVRALTNFHIRYNLRLSMNNPAIRQGLSGSGLRSTPQRYAVMAFLMKQDGHPTAAEIFAAVNRFDP